MNIAIIFAGGVGSRMGTTVKPKQFLEVDGKPIIIHTLEVFEKCEMIDYISIACLEEYIPFLKELLEKYKIKKVRWINPGGDTGQLSIYNGLKAVYDDKKIPKDSIVLIHDGVRPNIDEELVIKNIETAKELGNSVTVCMAQETVLMSMNHRVIDDIVNRDNVYHAKAPQCFVLKDLYQSHINALENGDIYNWDSCSLMYKNGYDINFTLGKNSNIKITTVEDFHLYETMYFLKKEGKEEKILISDKNDNY